MKKAIIPKWALLDSGIQKQNPAASSVQHMLGKVTRSKLLELVYLHRVHIGFYSRSSSICVNCPNRRPCEKEIDQAESPGSQKRLRNVGSSVGEYGGGIEGNDVDAAHLLSNHHNARRPGCSSNSRNGEEFNKSGKEVTVRGNGRGRNHGVFGFKLGVNEVQVSGGLQRCATQTQK